MFRNLLCSLEFSAGRLPSFEDTLERNLVVSDSYKRGTIGGFKGISQSAPE
jgi:hypothetical protein